MECSYHHKNGKSQSIEAIRDKKNKLVGVLNENRNRKEFPQYFKSSYPEEFGLFSHLETTAAIPTALFAITTKLL